MLACVLLFIIAAPCERCTIVLYSDDFIYIFHVAFYSAITICLPLNSCGSHLIEATHSHTSKIANALDVCHAKAASYTSRHYVELLWIGWI